MKIVCHILLLIMLMLLFPVTGRCVTASENYVRIISPIEASTSVLPFDYDFSNVCVSYFDGLGRKFADVSVTTSAGDLDMVTFYEYDKLGRVNKSFLPFETQDVTGNLPSFNLSDIYSYHNDDFPYSEVTYFEMTDKPVCEFGPGKNWRTNGNAIQHDYRFNETNKKQYCCALYCVDNGLLVNKGYYKTASLFVEVIKNENGDSTAVFTDKADRKILVRNFLSDSEFADTYYVYDNAGRICFIISPEGATRLSLKGGCDESVIEKYCYSYRYDDRNRIVAKHIPGCGEVRMVYDKADNVIMSQTESQRKISEWTITKYDNNYRPAVMG